MMRMLSMLCRRNLIKEGSAVDEITVGCSGDWKVPELLDANLKRGLTL